MKKEDEASLQDSGATPYLYDNYQQSVNTTMERSFYRTAPELESQFKKPYLKGSHPQSEWEFSFPEFPFYPNPFWIPGGGFPDCKVSGSTAGTAKDPCDPAVSCSRWLFSCAHKIVKFGVSSKCGWIEAVEYQPGDLVVVTVCWDEGCRSKGSKVGPKAVLANGTDVVAGNFMDMSNCCNDKINPVISGYSQQMSCSGTQTLTASGGNGPPYRWSVIAGSGTVSPSTSTTTTYTAPSTNPNCANNPTIQLKDKCGRTKTVQFAVNCYALGVRAYRRNYCEGSGSNCWLWQENLDCAGVSLGLQFAEGCTVYHAYPCSDGACQYWFQNECTPSCSLGYEDLRSAAQIAGGCCPAALL